MKRIITTVLILIIIFIVYLELKIPHYVYQKKLMIGYYVLSVYDFIWYKFYGFWALFGLVGCMFLIYFTKLIVNKFVKRDESYYG